MSGLYDRVLDQMGDEDDDTQVGLTPLEMAELPDEQRQVMFSFLRDAKETAGTLTQDALQEKHENLDDLVSILADLTKNGWLIRLGEASSVRYKVNFRRRRASKLKSNMWASLTDRLSEESSSERDQRRDQSDDQPTLPSLSDW